MHRLARLSLKALRLRHDAPHRWPSVIVRNGPSADRLPFCFWRDSMWSCEQLIPSEQICLKAP